MDKWESYRPDIYFLIEATGEFIVYLDSENDVDWETDSYTEGSKADATRFNAALNRAAVLEATPCTGLSFEMRRHFKRLVGEGIARALEHEHELAQGVLNSAEAYVRARSQELSRFWYLSASFVAAAPFALLGLLFWLAPAATSAVVGKPGYLLVLSAVSGVLGALLSVIARTGAQTFDTSSSKSTHYLEAISRIFAGGISGVIVTVAVQAGLVLGGFVKNPYDPHVILLVALAAGSSERLATSIMENISENKLRKPNGD
ncbi:MAG TPA: hypothetical protein VHZ78_14785 [Rhizomicrobium sp.]|nr:hypothetical protein [Rhizomicrobium sp.]